MQRRLGPSETRFEAVNLGVSANDPRDYYFRKRFYRLNIETITEMHGGEYAGKHARYVLRSRVAFADPADATRRGGDQ